MSNVIKKFKNNKIAVTITEILVFLLCLPFINIIIEAIFDIGRLVGTTARIIN